MTDPEILLTKRKEYSHEIINLTKERFSSVCKEIYKNACKQNKVARFLLRDFQLELRNVASWGTEEIEQLCKKFHQVQSLSRLLYNLHVINFKIFTQGSSCLLPQVPCPDTYPIKEFVYNVTLIMARELWRKPQLLYDKVETKIMLENKKEIDKLVLESIKEGLRKLVSVQKCEERLEVLEELEDQEIAQQVKEEVEQAMESDSDIFHDQVPGSEPVTESELPDSDFDDESKLDLDTDSETTTSTSDDEAEEVKKKRIKYEEIPPPLEVKKSGVMPVVEQPAESQPIAPPQDRKDEEKLYDIDEAILGIDEPDEKVVVEPIASDEPAFDDISEIGKVKRRPSNMSKKGMINANLDTYKTYYNSQMNDNLKYFVNRKKLADQHKFY